jgi:hypothetical protein
MYMGLGMSGKIKYTQLSPQKLRTTLLRSLPKSKRYKSPGTNQILAEFNQAVGNTLCSEIHEYINSI